jgi:hypothetical protein
VTVRRVRAGARDSDRRPPATTATSVAEYDIENAMYRQGRSTVATYSTVLLLSVNCQACGGGHLLLVAASARLDC